MAYRITPLQAFADNYIWLIDNGREALCIDPGEAEPVLTFLDANGLNLSQIWLTHGHNDHIGGVAQLKQRFSGCRVFGAADIAVADETLSEGSVVQWQDVRAQVWHTPGHTEQHISFIAEISGSLNVFCGDTLFSGGCGRAFTGRPDWLYRSLQRFDTLPENTLFYPAHEYTAANLRFAAHIEPDNADIQAALSAAETRADKPTLPVDLAHERRINPFLRVHLAAVAQRVAQEYPHTDRQPENVFAALRDWKNRF